MISEAAPDNVLAIPVSGVRAVLSIVQASSVNTGTYECIATAEEDDEVVTTSVDVSVI